MPIIKEHNTETNEIIEREMNPEELAQWQQTVKQGIADRIAREEAKAKKEESLAKLAALGLTAEDLKAVGL